MPRSLASSSEGYSAESYATTPSVESADALERAAKLRRQQEEHEARKRAERQALQESFALAALFEVCMYYLEAHIRLNNPDRRSSSAKLAAQRRQLRATDPGQVHAIICPQLEEAQVRELDRAYTFVGGLFQRGVLPNDLAWLEQTGSADGPPRHVCVQHHALPDDTSGNIWSLAWQTTWSCIWWDRRMASCTSPPSMHCSRFWMTRVSSGSSNGTKASWTRRTHPSRLLARARGIRVEDVPHARDLGRSLRPLRWRRGRSSCCRFRRRRQRRGLCLHRLLRLLKPLQGPARQLYSRLFVGRAPGSEVVSSSAPVLAELNPRTTTTALTRSGRPGPKSRGKGMVQGIRNSRTMLGLLLYMHLISSTVAIPPLADTRVEGNPHLEPSGVGRSSNLHSPLRTNPTGVSPATTTNPVRKRAFARAQQRARIHRPLDVSCGARS